MSGQVMRPAEGNAAHKTKRHCRVDDGRRQPSGGTLGPGPLRARLPPRDPARLTVIHSDTSRFDYLCTL
eukprot:898325-Pleurochrysis_carterae.AAC.2